jgi:hypothetical protein
MTVSGRDERIREYFALADEYGLQPTADRYSPFINPSVVVKFGNAEPIEGLEALIASAPMMRSVVSATKHEVVTIHHDTSGRYATVEMIVTYTRLNGGELVVPCAVVLGFDDQDLILEYRIYMDASELFGS